MSSPSPTPSPVPGTSWHVPGPSSRYHKREGTYAPKSSRPPSALGVEADHQRPQAISTPHRSSHSSPPSAHMASLSRRHTAPLTDAQDPLTPINSPHHVTLLHHQNSPFSDYFTDEARSVSQKAAYAMPPPEVQQVLLRLNNLGAQLLRQRPTSDSYDAIATQLDQLEQVLEGAEQGSGHRRSMEDSGFIDDFPDGNESPPSPEVKANESSLHNSTPPLTAKAQTSPISKPNRHDTQSIYHRRLLAEAQKLLERVSQANNHLRTRFDEMRDLSEQNASQVEEATLEVLNLRSENEHLKADLNFDHSELLYLKLQFKALEMQADDLYNEERKSGSPTHKRILLEEGMEQWKQMWDDIDARFRGRRTEHRVVSAKPSDLVRHREDGRSADEQGDWKLDVSKKRNGRIQSITISRFNDRGINGAQDGEHSSEDGRLSEDEQPGNPVVHNPQSVKPSCAIMIKTIHAEEPSNWDTSDIKSVPLTMVDSGTQTTKLTQHAVRFSETATVYQQIREAESSDEDQPDEHDGHKERNADRTKECKTPWQELMDSLADFTGMSKLD